MSSKQKYQTVPPQENSSSTGIYSLFARILGRNSPSPTPGLPTQEERVHHTPAISLPIFVELPDDELTELSSNFKIFEETASTEQFKKVLLDKGYPYAQDSCATLYFGKGTQPTMEKGKQRLSIIYSSDGTVLLEKFTDESFKKALAFIESIQPGKELTEKFAINLMSEVNLILLEAVAEKFNSPFPQHVLTP